MQYCVTVQIERFRCKFFSDNIAKLVTKSKELTDGGAKTITVDTAAAAYGTCTRMSFHPMLHKQKRVYEESNIKSFEGYQCHYLPKLTRLHCKEWPA